jgi:hypothetical protein
MLSAAIFFGYGVVALGCQLAPFSRSMGIGTVCTAVGVGVAAAAGTESMHPLIPIPATSAITRAAVEISGIQKHSNPRLQLVLVG